MSLYYDENYLSYFHCILGAKTLPRKYDMKTTTKECSEITYGELILSLSLLSRLSLLPISLAKPIDKYWQK
jgi:hypothetical protein